MGNFAGVSRVAGLERIFLQHFGIERVFGAQGAMVAGQQDLLRVGVAVDFSGCFYFFLKLLVDGLLLLLLVLLSNRHCQQLSDLFTQSELRAEFIGFGLDVSLAVHQNDLRPAVADIDFDFEGGGVR